MKSHLNDKPTCCLPLRPQSRHSDLWYFGAQLLSLQPCCLRLAHYITVIHSRLASNAVVSSLFDRISTCWIVHPLLDARSGTNVEECRIVWINKSTMVEHNLVLHARNAYHKHQNNYRRHPLPHTPTDFQIHP